MVDLDQVPSAPTRVRFPEPAEHRGIGKAYVGQVLRLTLLAPEGVEAILDGPQREELQLEDPLKGFPLEREAQTWR